MNSYKALNKQIFHKEDYSIVPVRFQDRRDIMNWRNEQIYHLRQDSQLTEEDQNNYFKNVIARSFQENQPNQILFSFLKKNSCIGYGGLVHINWIDKNAEISFLMNTKLENEYFEKYWSKFLSLIEKVAFEELKMHKIYIYSFDLRPKLYEILTRNHYFFDAKLNDHCLFNGKFIDVLIYSKIK